MRLAITTIEPVGAIDVNSVADTYAKEKSSGKDSSAAVGAAVGTVFGPIGTAVGGLLGGMLGRGRCDANTKPTPTGPWEPVTDKQAAWWAQNEQHTSAAKAFQKCQDCGPNWGVSVGECIAWHYYNKRGKYGYRLSPYDAPAEITQRRQPAPTPAPAQAQPRAPAPQAAAPAGYAMSAYYGAPAYYSPPPQRYMQHPSYAPGYPARASMAAYGGRPAPQAFAGQQARQRLSAADQRALQFQEQRSQIDAKLSQFREALVNAERNYQRAITSRNQASAQAWASYHQQVAQGIAQLEQQRIAVAA